MDFNVEPYKNNDVRMQNFVNENDIEQPYKLANKVELWTFIKLVDFAWPCMYFAIVGIYACIDQICPNARCICVWPCDNCDIILKFITYNFWAFKALLECKHESIQMQWIPNLNIL